MIVSGHDLLTTRICAAFNCGDDALNGWALCARCDRRHRAGCQVELHVIPEPLPPSLPCSACKRELPDDAFIMRPPGPGAASSNRRGRKSECRECSNAARRVRRTLEKTQVESETA